MDLGQEAGFQSNLLRLTLEHFIALIRPEKT